jgi:HAD superfamily hydrolase (TIGR01509 family)
MSSYPDWNKIETVFLDLDGTLLDLHFDNHFWLEYVPIHYADKHELSHEEASQVLMDKYTEVRGQLEWYCVDYWSRELELDIEQLKHQVSHKISVRPQVSNFLQAVRRIGKHIVLVTNAHPASVSLKMQKTGLEDYFDRIINAHDIGLAKEHNGFWERLKAMESYDPETTLLIDDNIEVLESAEHYGIKHLLAVRRPDSQGDEVETRLYQALEAFEDIMPRSF